MGRSVIETLMGALVLIVAAFFVFISYKSGNISGSNSQNYNINAKFKEIGTLSIGSDVRIGGIKIGTVSNQFLDNQSYKANVQISVEKGVKIPKDSSASIVGDGLLGGKYLAIIPGGDEDYIKEGGEIRYTQDSVSLEELIGKFAFGGLEDSDN